jgi:prefoldin beta subunit
MDILQSLRGRLEALVEDVNTIQKDLGKAMNTRQSLTAQLTENQMVKSELDLLSDDAVVYKLVGPILVKQVSFYKIDFHPLQYESFHIL